MLTLMYFVFFDALQAKVRETMGSDMEIVSTISPEKRIQNSMEADS